MKIATWNVNSIRTRQQQVLDWLQLNCVDVLCLQETKVIDGSFPVAPFAELGYHLYIFGQKAYNGVAIFSRTPVEQVAKGFASAIGEELSAEFDQQKRVISGLVGNLRIVNLYVPNGSSVGSEKYQYKLHWLQVLREYLRVLSHQSPGGMCVCGDFNVAPEDRDIYDPSGKENHIMATSAEREMLQAALSAAELKDAFRKFKSEGGYFSWWDYRTRAFAYNRGWRIDHHYLTPNLYQRAIACEIDLMPRKLPKPSDHAPVIVEIA